MSAYANVSTITAGPIMIRTQATAGHQFGSLCKKEHARAVVKNSAAHSTSSAARAMKGQRFMGFPSKPFDATILSHRALLDDVVLGVSKVLRRVDIHERIDRVCVKAHTDVR